MKISINLPEELLKDMDKVCLDERYERSEFIRTAIRDRIYPKDIQPPKEKHYTEKIDEVPKEVKEEPTLEPGTVFDFCKGHWEAVKGKKYVLRKITYEDENANPIVNKQWLCEKCIKKWEERGVGRVYYL